MKRKDVEEVECAENNWRHTVQVSEKAWKMLTVLKLMYKKSFGHLVEESALKMIRSTPYGNAHLKFILNDNKFDKITVGSDDNKYQTKTIKRGGNKIIKSDNHRVTTIKKGGNKNVEHSS